MQDHQIIRAFTIILAVTTRKIQFLLGEKMRGRESCDGWLPTVQEFPTAFVDFSPFPLRRVSSL